jgi:ABC-2 type transport system ATP-binding protein
MSSILSISNLVKKYPSLFAVSNLSLEVEKGSVYGILGPNGSGKTTTLGIILGVINQTSGSYSWFDNKNIAESRKEIGSLLETPNFYHYMSAWDNLRITAKIKNVPETDIQRVASLVELDQRLTDKFRTFSLGMKQRLAIGAALLGNPKVLVLDEPTNGLDPQGIVEIRELIRKISKEGVTILLASHALDEVEKVCSHVCVIKNGKQLFQGNVNEVLSGENMIELSADNMENLKSTLSTFPTVIDIKEENNKLTVKLNDAGQPIELNKHLVKNGIIVNHFVIRTKNLEEFFLETTS